MATNNPSRRKPVLMMRIGVGEADEEQEQADEKRRMMGEDHHAGEEGEMNDDECGRDGPVGGLVVRCAQRGELAAEQQHGTQRVDRDR
jgi:hypothetical protein